MCAFDGSVRGSSAARPGERANAADRRPAKRKVATRQRNDNALQRGGQLSRGELIAGKPRSIALVGRARQLWSAECDAQAEQRRGGNNKRRRRGWQRLFKLGCGAWKFWIDSAARRNLARQFGIFCNRWQQIDEQAGERNVCSRRIAELHGRDSGFHDQAYPYAARSCPGLARIGRRAHRRRSASRNIEPNFERPTRQHLGTHKYEAGRHRSSQPNEHTEPQQNKRRHRNKAFRARIDDAIAVSLLAVNQHVRCRRT